MLFPGPVSTTSGRVRPGEVVANADLSPWSPKVARELRAECALCLSAGWILRREKKEDGKSKTGERDSPALDSSKLGRYYVGSQ